ncbi:MAG: flagellar hook-associated protein FlgK, partial [Rhodospirillaceae bacterium]|nr:flagellar hook-associated protein FlgK [Rhodospirillaceae bacterium]
SVSSSITYASGGFDAITLDNADITNQISSGTLAALVNQRDLVLTNAQAELDNLASTLSSALNACSNQGSASTPQRSLTGSTS